MSADIEQLTRGVERVSLGCRPQKNPRRNESLAENVENNGLAYDHSDVDMSDSPSRPPAPEETHEESAQDDSASYPRDELCNGIYENDPSTNSSETSTLHLRRSGKSSLGLSKDFCEVFYAVFASGAYFAISNWLSNTGTVTKVLQNIGSLNLVCVSLLQVISIFKLLRDLLCLGWTTRAASKITAPSKRGGASRARRKEGRWNLSAADKVDNCACKVLVLLSLILTRICVVLLCNFFLGFVAADYESLIKTGYENLNAMMSLVDKVTYEGMLSSDLHANVLRECKTIPELVFESRHMCT